MPLDEQGTFVAVPPRASPVAAYLSPEGPEEPAAGGAAGGAEGVGRPDPDGLEPQAIPEGPAPGAAAR